MTREWFSMRELLTLPSLPGTVKGLLLQAKRDAWSSRAREGRGGGREYHISNLPFAARAELARRESGILSEHGRGHDPGTTAGSAASTKPAAGASVEALHPLADTPAAAGIPPRLRPDREIDIRDPLAGRPGRVASARVLAISGESSVPTFLELPEWAQQLADARAAILRAFGSFQPALALKVREREFARLYSAGGIEGAASVREIVPALSGPTLCRYRQAFARDGLSALAASFGHHRRGGGTIERDSELRDFIIALIQNRHHLSARNARDSIRARLGARAMPSIRSIQRFICDYRRRHPAELAAIRNPDDFRNRYRVSLAKADSEIVRLNQQWQIDGTPGDAILVGGRHHVMALIDVWSRRMMFLVSKTARSSAAGALIRRAILAWGVPEEIKGDNGKEFIARNLQRALDDLGVPYIASAPFSPEQKPFIERGIGTLMHDLFPQLPGYIGHSVADRKAIESRRSFARRLGTDRIELFQVSLTAAELQTRLDAWADSAYGGRSHSGLGGRTPNEVAAAYGGEVRSVEKERALDLLLGEGVVRMVGKEGVRLEGARFFAAELVAHIGREILAIADADMGRVMVYSIDPREFICVAHNLDREGVSRVEMAIVARQLQSRAVTAHRKQARALKSRFTTHRVADAVLKYAAAGASGSAALAVRVDYSTPGIAAALDAAEVLDAPAHQPREHDSEVLSAGDEAIGKWERRQRAREDQAAEDREWREREWARKAR